MLCGVKMFRALTTCGVLLVVSAVIQVSHGRSLAKDVDRDGLKKALTALLEKMDSTSEEKEVTSEKQAQCNIDNMNMDSTTPPISLKAAQSQMASAGSTIVKAFATLNKNKDVIMKGVADLSQFLSSNNYDFNTAKSKALLLMQKWMMPFSSAQMQTDCAFTKVLFLKLRILMTGIQGDGGESRCSKLRTVLAKLPASTTLSSKSMRAVAGALLSDTECVGIYANDMGNSFLQSAHASVGNMTNGEEVFKAHVLNAITQDFFIVASGPIQGLSTVLNHVQANSGSNPYSPEMKGTGRIDTLPAARLLDSNEKLVKKLESAYQHPSAKQLPNENVECKDSPIAHSDFVKAFTDLGNALQKLANKDDTDKDFAAAKGTLASDLASGKVKDSQLMEDAMTFFNALMLHAMTTMNDVMTDSSALGTVVTTAKACGTTGYPGNNTMCNTLALDVAKYGSGAVSSKVQKQFLADFAYDVACMAEFQSQLADSIKTVNMKKVTFDIPALITMTVYYTLYTDMLWAAQGLHTAAASIFNQ